MSTTERDDLLETLRKHRGFLRQTTDGMDDEQIRARSTVSGLCLGGIVKHVTAVERTWADFIVKGPSRPVELDEATVAQYLAQHRVEDGEHLAGLLADYADAAATTDDLVRTAPDLDASWPLPEAPWFPPGTRWSVRRVLLHLLAETSQHAGHADIIRESIDGAKTMG